jgi:hypothetical protein
MRSTRNDQTQTGRNSMQIVCHEGLLVEPVMKDVVIIKTESKVFLMAHFLAWKSNKLRIY